ncbi:TRAP transporter small permease [Roseicella aquatilis]|uniref:TRAP transporter small permease protein n=2 Tax=Roseicella aquatilis TaxID=2527868 RepID=A0A4R4D867_9PROT|nr:TRAP transporter small permease [Roseicella aquatilis]
MVVMVFGNVVLRYAFDGGITVSEELSRFLFVWLTFLGSVAVMRQNGHLGFDLVVRALPRAGRQACRILSDLLMLACCALFLWGAWEQTVLNLSNAAPVSGLPLGWAYASAVLCALGLMLLVGADLLAALRGEDPPGPPHDLAEPGA